MKLLKSSIWSFLAVLVRGISALTINKIFAVQFGPAGIGLLSHFQNLTTIFTTIPNDGINRGLIRYLSPENISLETKRKYFATGFYLNLIAFAVTLPLILLFKDLFLAEFEMLNDSFWVISLSICMIFLLLDYYIIAVILSFRKTEHFFAAELIASILFFVIAYLGFADKKITSDEALMYYMIALSSGFLIVTIIAFTQKQYKEVISFKLDIKFGFTDLRKFIIMATFAMAFGKLLDFLIRAYAFTLYTDQEVGIWIGAVKISDYYMMAFTAVTMAAYYPNITASIHDSLKLRNTVIEGLKLFVPIITLGCLTVYFLRAEFLEYLLDPEFISAAPILSFQVSADFLKMISMLLSLILLAQSRTKIFIISEVFSAIVYIISIYIMIPLFGIEGIAIAGLIRYLFYFVFLFFIFKDLFFAKKS